MLGEFVVIALIGSVASFDIGREETRECLVKLPIRILDESAASDRQHLPSQSSAPALCAARQDPFYQYLNEESLVDVIPIKYIRQKSKFLRKDHNQALIRRLSNLQWDYVPEAAGMLVDENPAEHERTLFIMTALFAMYLRISELISEERSAPVMGGFKKDRDRTFLQSTLS